MMICKNCKNEISDDSLFCEHCGSKVVAEEVGSGFTVCPTCGEKVEAGKNFCRNCGASLKGTPSPEVMEERPDVETVYRAPYAPRSVQPTPEYAQPATNPQIQQTPKPNPPAYKIRTNRGLAKFFFLSLITFGIYGIVVLSKISHEINTIASKHDGRHTMHYCLIYFIFSWLTLGIVPLVWYSRISSRIGNELRYRKIHYHFGAGAFWGLNFFGQIVPTVIGLSMIYGNPYDEDMMWIGLAICVLGIICPFIYIHKLMKSMNLLAKDYNINGND